MEVFVQLGICWFGVSLIGGVLGKLFGFGFWRSFLVSGGAYLVFTVLKAATRTSGS
ncbi:hypothetical protein [Vibrio hippocampi]|uniref:hypothetical protein n=1 Tax=Vibrio hippocampi TaxID=654686 RepID=UPI001F3EC710|nr:hypothetical protein [Vibrio hippocampi]